jgi:hypothetical protein
LDHRRAVLALHTDKECTCPAEESSGRRGKKRKAEEILQRRAEVRKKNAEIESSRWACDSRTRTTCLYGGIGWWTIFLDQAREGKQSLARKPLQSPYVCRGAPAAPVWF